MSDSSTGYALHALIHHMRCGYVPAGFVCALDWQLHTDSQDPDTRATRDFLNLCLNDLNKTAMNEQDTRESTRTSNSRPPPPRRPPPKPAARVTASEAVIDVESTEISSQARIDEQERGASDDEAALLAQWGGGSSDEESAEVEEYEHAQKHFDEETSVVPSTTDSTFEAPPESVTAEESEKVARLHSGTGTESPSQVIERLPDDESDDEAALLAQWGGEDSDDESVLSQPDVNDGVDNVLQQPSPLRQEEEVVPVQPNRAHVGREQHAADSERAQRLAQQKLQRRMSLEQTSRPVSAVARPFVPVPRPQRSGTVQVRPGLESVVSEAKERGSAVKPQKSPSAEPGASNNHGRSSSSSIVSGSSSASSASSGSSSSARRKSIQLSGPRTPKSSPQQQVQPVHEASAAEQQMKMLQQQLKLKEQEQTEKDRAWERRMQQQEQQVALQKERELREQQSQLKALQQKLEEQEREQRKKELAFENKMREQQQQQQQQQQRKLRDGRLEKETPSSDVPRVARAKPRRSGSILVRPVTSLPPTPDDVPMAESNRGEQRQLPQPALRKRVGSNATDNAEPNMSSPERQPGRIGRAAPAPAPFPRDNAVYDRYYGSPAAAEVELRLPPRDTGVSERLVPRTPAPAPYFPGTRQLQAQVFNSKSGVDVQYSADENPYPSTFLATTGAYTSQPNDNPYPSPEIMQNENPYPSQGFAARRMSGQASPEYERVRNMSTDRPNLGSTGSDRTRVFAPHLAKSAASGPPLMQFVRHHVDKLPLIFAASGNTTFRFGLSLATCCAG